jgi:hypothetical protein
MSFRKTDDAPDHVVLARVLSGWQSDVPKVDFGPAEVNAKQWNSPGAGSGEAMCPASQPSRAQRL